MINLKKILVKLVRLLPICPKQKLINKLALWVRLLLTCPKQKLIDKLAPRLRILHTLALTLLCVNARGWRLPHKAKYNPI